MSKIVIFSAANPAATANLTHSVRAGVPLRLLGDSVIAPQLHAHYQDARARLWGSPTGDRGRKRTVWNHIDPPAVAFFYTDGGFRLAARIWAKEPLASDGKTGSPDLAEAVWHDPNFQHLVYLDQVEEIDVSSEELKAALGYESRYLLGREFMVPDSDREQDVLKAFGSVEAFRDSVIGHVGVPLLQPGLVTVLPTALGAAYRTEAEDTKAQRKEIYQVDPDAADRGTQGHAKTQNALAEHLIAKGITPRSWSVAEPPYDIAWETDGSIYVAEVKSLTRRNEERQLRMAVGQILRYAQQLAYKQKPVEKVIATERKPHDPSWMALCAELDITLVWPESFVHLP